MKKCIALVVCAALLLSLFSGCAGKSDEKDKGTFTLMVYMVGSDLESKYMVASNDLSEMLDSDLSLDNVNLWYIPAALKGGMPTFRATPTRLFL